MPSSASSARGLVRDLDFSLGEDPEADMRRLDRLEVDIVCRHLLGDAPVTTASAERTP